MADFFEVTEDTYNAEVLKSSMPVLVEFGAPWCAPCKRIEPILKQLGEEWAGKVRLVKVDVDVCQRLAEQLQVFSVPTIILYKNGEPVERFSGLMPREKLVERLGPHL